MRIGDNLRSVPQPLWLALIMSVLAAAEVCSS